MIWRIVIAVVGFISTIPFSDAVPESPLTATRLDLRLLQRWKAQKAWEESHNVTKLEKLMGRVSEDLKTMGNVTGFLPQWSRNVSFVECIKSLGHLAIDSANKTTYALKALDADGKLPSGIQLGNIKWSGRFHECRQVKAEYFNGKWCALTVGQATQTPMGSSSTGFFLGLCLPDTCPEEFFNDAIPSSLEIGNASESVAVKCPVQLTEWTSTDVASMFVFSLLLFLTVLGTTADLLFRWKIEREEKQLSINGDGIEIRQDLHKVQKLPAWAETAASFSIIKNTKALLATDSRPGTIDALHGMRFISITWVVLGHTYVMVLGSTDNILDVMDWFFKAFSFQAISNATFSVDTFFFIGGLLVTFLALKDSSQFSGRRIPSMYLQRYLRITPAYAFLILFSVGFYGKIGEGPFWPEYFNATRTPCTNYWWTNLLYINNLYPSTLMDQCYALGWYLGNDMQFFLLAPFSILLLKRRPKAGIGLLVFGIFASVLVTGIISAHYKAQPQPIGLALLIKLLLGGMPGGDVPHENGTNHVTNVGMPPMSPKDTFWSDTYGKPWCRIGVYLIGMITGYILHATKLKIKMPTLAVISGWAVAAGLNIGLLYGLWYYVRTKTPMVVSLAAFYDAMCRPMWAVGLAWVVIACATGNGGLINTFLSWKAFVPLSRLTFCIYLVHPLVLGWWFYTLEVTIHYSNIQFAFFFLAILTSSVAVAYVVSMLTEVPFTNLSKMFLRRRVQQQARREQEAESQQLLGGGSENLDA